MTKDGGKEMFIEMKNLIPADRMRDADDLYRKWQAIRAGESRAVIIDMRTEGEFDSGHIQDSTHINSDHAYTIPGKWADPEQEMWVLCRTTHKATYLAALLYGFGYKNVYLVDKGIVEWFEKGYPIVKTKYHRKIDVVKYDKKLKDMCA